MAGTRRLVGAFITALVTGVVLSLLAPVGAAHADPRTPTPEQDRLSDQQAEVTLEEALGEAYAGRSVSKRWSTYLCTGYRGCRQAGYGNRGYRANSGHMYWLMYSGHNCTNYAAYRMVRAGMANRRPWSGTGNAYYWGRAKRRITSDKPMVGAVAWWRANVPGAGSNGHVAYVEKVISKRKIIISEDSWSGDFHWRRINKRDGSWPSGFIHFKDVKVRALKRPAIVGAPQVGVPLTLDTGTWKPSARLTQQWYADGRPITGATGASWTPTPDQVRQHLAVRFVAKKFGYRPGAARTELTTRIRPGDLKLHDGAAILGRPQVGETLRVDRPSWRPAVDTFAFQWFAGDEPIPGATSARLRLTPDLVHREISVRTVGRTHGYNKGVDTTSRTTPVRRGRFQVTSPFALGGRLLVGRTLTVTRGAFTPSDGKVSYTWLRDGNPIDGARAATYELTGRDLGRTISVQARLHRQGYRPRTVNLGSQDAVLTRPHVELTRKVIHRRVRVRVELTAPGVKTVRGPVTLRIDGRTLTRTLAEGRAHWTVKHLAPGTYRLRFAYAGTRLVTGRVMRTEAKVRRHH